jgi:hypothetical protein
MENFIFVCIHTFLVMSAKTIDSNFAKQTAGFDEVLTNNFIINEATIENDTRILAVNLNGKLFKGLIIFVILDFHQFIGCCFFLGM